jgi:hypothetical protein
MRVAMLGINYRPEETGIGVFNTGRCEYLVERGHDITMFTGFPYIVFPSKVLTLLAAGRPTVASVISASSEVARVRREAGAGLVGPPRTRLPCGTSCSVSATIPTPARAWGRPGARTPGCTGIGPASSPRWRRGSPRWPATSEGARPARPRDDRAGRPSQASITRPPDGADVR